MNIKQLETFTTVANYLSFTKASEELYTTQSSVSKIIKSLEEELSVQLFYRTPQIQLTDAGNVLFMYSVSILEMLNNLQLDIGGLSGLKKGQVNVGIPPIIGSSFFPAIVGKFKSDHPEIDIILTEVGSKGIKEELDEGILDVGIVCSYPSEKEDYLMFPIVKSPLMVGVNVDSPLANRSTISFKDLRDESFVLFNKDFSLYDSIIEGCHQSGFFPRIICNSSQRDFLLEMVSLNLGVTFLAQIICENITSKNIRFIPLEDPQIIFNLLVIWKKNRYMSYASREWLRFTADYLDLDITV